MYQYDFTEFTDEDVGDDGRFGFRYLDAYFNEPDRRALLLRIHGRWAGFALLRRGASLAGDPDVMDVSEFFVMRKYRRRGLGTEMAHRVFARFPGRWQVRVMAANTPAQAFWCRAVAEAAAGRFDERLWDDDLWRGPVFSFDNATGGAPRPA